MIILGGILGVLMAGMMVDVSALTSRHAEDDDDDTPVPDEEEGESLPPTMPEPQPEPEPEPEPEVPAAPDESVIDGSDGLDFLMGTPGDDLIRGQGGADDLRGGLGADTIEAGAGDDWVQGDAVYGLAVTTLSMVARATTCWPVRAAMTCCSEKMATTP